MCHVEGTLRKPDGQKQRKKVKIKLVSWLLNLFLNARLKTRGASF